MRTKALYIGGLWSISAIAQAGEEPFTEVRSAGPMVTPPSPIYQWFVGGTGGYLEDLGTEFYSAHIGVDLPYQIGGWDPAVYLEVGYAEEDFDILTNSVFDVQLAPNSKGPQPGISFSVTNVEIEIIPISLNYKLERELAEAWRAYIGIGAGVAFVDVDASGAVNASDDDTTFYGQVFGGLLYQATEAFEVFGGVRWIYLDDVEFFGVSLDVEDDVLFEGGVRINF